MSGGTGPKLRLCGHCSQHGHIVHEGGATREFATKREGCKEVHNLILSRKLLVYDAAVIRLEIEDSRLASYSHVRLADVLGRCNGDESRLGLFASTEAEVAMPQ